MNPRPTFAQTVDGFEQNPRLRTGFQCALALAVILFVFLLYSVMATNAAAWGIYFFLVIMLGPVLALFSIDRLLTGLKEWHLEETPQDCAPQGRTAAQTLQRIWTRRAVGGAVASGLSALVLQLTGDPFGPIAALIMICAACAFFAFFLFCAIPDADQSRKVQQQRAATRAASPTAKRIENKHFFKEGVVFGAVAVLVLGRLAGDLLGLDMPASQVGQSICAVLGIALVFGLAQGYSRWRRKRTS